MEQGTRVSILAAEVAQMSATGTVHEVISEDEIIVELDGLPDDERLVMMHPAELTVQ